MCGQLWGVDFWRFGAYVLYCGCVLDPYLYFQSRSHWCRLFYRISDGSGNKSMALGFESQALARPELELWLGRAKTQPEIWPVGHGF